MAMPLVSDAARSRDAAINRAVSALDEGRFARDLGDLVAMRTESQDPDAGVRLHAYLAQGIAPRLDRLGFTCRTIDNPDGRHGPLLLAARQEGLELPTVLLYGHGDTVRGEAARWSEGLDPFSLTERDGRFYGRGAADNKGQHLINLTALEAVLEAGGGRLGFNIKLLLEMGEEVGSPGLHAVCERHSADLAADVLIASDGPRLSLDRPTLFLGSRGVTTISLSVELRDSGHHSGNWGGVLANPATILASAMASLVDARGRILVERLRAPAIDETIRAHLAKVALEPSADAPDIDPDWGEEGFSPPERIYALNAFEIIAFVSGDPEHPQNAIPGSARAVMQLRFVVGTPAEEIVAIVAEHLAARGFACVRVAPAEMQPMKATRSEPGGPWVRWAHRSIERSTGKTIALLPSFGGALPNDAFADILGLPTLWVPHSYPGCRQHGSDEHLPVSLAREGLAVMAGLFWDLGHDAPAWRVTTTDTNDRGKAAP